MKLQFAHYNSNTMMSILPYHIAPPGWTYAASNPFTTDGSYGAAWSAFCILDSQDDQYVTGQSGQGPFAARFGSNVPRLERRLADFLRYEQAQERQVILDFPPDIDPAVYVAQAIASTPAPNEIRPEDPPVLVHSTSLAAWQSIRADGALKSAAQLTHTGSPNSQDHGLLDDYLRHEPPEYRDHIMLGEIASCGPEMVVASYQAGRFVMDEQATYQPGVRLYFDNHRIIRDGLGVRDGLHVMKVRQRLPLRPYLIAAICAQDLSPNDTWTLRAFVDQANAELFQMKADFSKPDI
jgi:hypothetical protein